jgi:hypothetical protein
VECGGVEVCDSVIACAWQMVQLYTFTGGATENKEDKNLYKQIIRLLKN